MRTTLVALLAALLLLPACGSDPTIPVDDPPVGPQPNPDGVLLGGDPTRPARDVLELLPPSPVAEADRAGPLLATRLVALLAPAATAGEVDAALVAAGATIVAMMPGQPFVSLRVPAQPDAAAARSLAAQLVATGAFLHAGPAFSPSTRGPLLTANETLGRRAQVDAPDHLVATHMLAAWKLDRLGLENQDRIVVLVPDHYAYSTPSQEIDAQSMRGWGLPSSLPGPEVVPGNNGVAVAGVIGANVDESAPTGSSPHPQQLLDIRSLPLGGLSWYDLLWLLSWELASAGNEFVLNTGLGYNDPGYLQHSKLERVMHALAWRVAAAGHQDAFVHVSGAPLGGSDAWLQSPFLAASAADDPRSQFAPGELDEGEAARLDAAWADLSANFPAATVATTKLLPVRAVSGNGTPLTAGMDGAIPALGQQVLGPCEIADPAATPGYLCDGDLAWYSGTSMAVAQVSGLAAYMLSLGDESPAQVRAAIEGAAAITPQGPLDHYLAVLALDGAGEFDLRHEMLDVAGFEGGPRDGRFDEHDLPRLEDLQYPAAFRAVDDVYPASLRPDLNGDGIVGGDATAPFDLDHDGQLGPVSKTIEGSTMGFDENAVTDFEIACWYSYSDAYRGDLTRRAQHMLAGHSSLVVEMSGVPERFEPGDSFEVLVRAGLRQEDGSVVYTAGIQVDLDADADIIPRDGLTDAGGEFRATVTVRSSHEDNTLEVEAEASTGGQGRVATRSSLRANSIELTERLVVLYEGLFATTSDPGQPSDTYINEFNLFEITDFSPFQENTQSSANATQDGISTTSSSSASATTRVELVGENGLRAVYADAQLAAQVAVQGSNPSLQGWQSNADAYFELSVEFTVWGEPAAYTLHGSASGDDYYAELDGYGEAGELLDCGGSDDPCPTISQSGALPPGEYDLDFGGSVDLMRRWFDGCSPCPPGAGSSSGQASLSLDFEVGHAGAASALSR